MNTDQNSVAFEKLQDGDKVVVQTRNSTYTILVTEPRLRTAVVQEEKHFPEGKRAFIQVFELGESLRFIPEGDDGIFISSYIRKIRLNGQRITSVG